MATSSRHRGWLHDATNGRLAAVYNGTEIFDYDGNDMVITPATTLTAAATFTSSVTSNLTGNAFVAPTGNVAIGTPGAFATTQPQGAVIMGGSSLTGIAPVGAITTAGAVFASDTVVRKIIAAGTASNIET